MKIIIAYASVASGHFKAAEAIYNHFKEEQPADEVLLVDALDESLPFFKSLYAGGYAFLVQYLPWLWGFIFWMTYAAFLRPLVTKIRAFINRLNTISFARFLIQHNPDIIISTQFLPSELSAFLKRKKKITSRLITVVTDFCIHPFWVRQGIDAYIVASDITKEQLAREGIDPEIIRATGIPIDRKFSASYDKALLKKKFGIADDVFTVLIMTGTFGIGPIEEIVELLFSQVQLLVVCAHNEKVFRRLKEKNYPGVKIFDYIDYVHELMAISDMIVTKPGGLTISELLAMELAPVFISPIPGQETENVKVLKAYGIGRSSQHPKDIANIVLDYKHNPAGLIEQKSRIKQIKKVTAMEGLFDAVRSGGIWPAR